MKCLVHFFQYKLLLKHFDTSWIFISRTIRKSECSMLSIFTNRRNGTFSGMCRVTRDSQNYILVMIEFVQPVTGAASLALRLSLCNVPSPSRFRCGRQRRNQQNGRTSGSGGEVRMRCTRNSCSDQMLRNLCHIQFWEIVKSKLSNFWNHVAENH